MNTETKRIVLIAFLSAVIGAVLGPVFLAWTYPYDLTKPEGTASPTLADDRMRETKAAAQERLNVDHYFALTGNELSTTDAATGQHRQIEFYGPITKPTNAANKGWVYTKDASAKVELHWLDEDGNEKQVTTAGALNIVSAELLGKLDNNTYFSAVDAAGTGTVDLIKANASGEVEIFHETAHPAQLSSSDAPVSDADIANKKYVDDQITAGADPAYSGGESHTFVGGLIIKRGTKTATAAGNTTVTFATPFPTALGTVIITMGGTTDHSLPVRVSSKHATDSFVIDNPNGGPSIAIEWFAIGY